MAAIWCLGVGSCNRPGRLRGTLIYGSIGTEMWRWASNPRILLDRDGAGIKEGRSFKLRLWDVVWLRRRSGIG